MHWDYGRGGNWGSLRLRAGWLENDDIADKTGKSREDRCGEEEGKFSLGDVEFEVQAADDRESGCGAGIQKQNLWNTEISHIEMKVNYLRKNLFPSLQWKLLREQTWSALQ